MAVGSMANEYSRVRGPSRSILSLLLLLLQINDFAHHYTTVDPSSSQMTDDHDSLFQSKNFKSEMWIQFKKLNLKTIPTKSSFVRFCLRQT